MLRSLAVLALVSIAARADAQAPPRSPADPRIWISASAGRMTYPQLNFLNSASRENAGYATNVRGSIEMDAGKIGGIGIAVATANIPINYVDRTIPTTCASGCPATVRTTSILATLHVGGGVGFDQVFEASAGFTRFGAIDPPVDPQVRGAATDFTGMVGYGFAYGFTPQLSAILVGDIGLAFHKNPSGGGIEAGYYSHQIGLRAGLRYGLWSRAR